MNAYQNALKEEWEALTPAPIEGAVHLDWEFSRRLGRYESSDTGRTVQKKRCDLSNVVKSSEDAIQPWLIVNDRNVMSMTARWHRQDADAEPFVRLVVTVLEDIS